MWFAADLLRLMGWRSSPENPQARNSFSDHKSDCAPVSAIADTLACLTSAAGSWQSSVLASDTDIKTLG